jgi:hypothetical protein
MRNLIGSIAAILTLGLAACVHTSDDPPTVRVGAGAGAGTMGIENSARIGSGR